MTRQIVERRETKLSAWLTLVEKDVYSPGPRSEISTFHSLLLDDYVSILALLSNRRVVLVRQFRPAVEREVYEFPGGLVDAGESSLQAAKRELFEECGLAGGTWRNLGRLDPDVGRLENHLHAYVCIEPEPSDKWTPEQNVKATIWSVDRLLAATREGVFNHSQHVAMLGLAFAHGLIAD